MKNLLKVLLGVLIVFAFTACSDDKNESKEENEVVVEEDVTEETEVVEEIVVYETAEEAYNALVQAIDVDKSAFRYYSGVTVSGEIDLELHIERADTDEWAGTRVLRDADGNLFVTYHNNNTGLRDLLYVYNGEHSYYVTSSFNTVENGIEVFDETKYSIETVNTQLGIYDGNIFMQDSEKSGWIDPGIVFDESNIVEEGDYFIVTNKEARNVVYTYKIAKDGSSREIIYTKDEKVSGYSKLQVVDDVEIELPEVE